MIVRFLSILILAGLLSACAAEEPGQVQDEEQIKAQNYGTDTSQTGAGPVIQDSAGRPVRQQQKPKLGFDLKSFMNTADSVATVLAGEPIRFRYVISSRLDTAKAKFAGIQPSKADRVQHYKLLPDKGIGEWDINIVRMIYTGNDLAVKNGYETCAKNATKNRGSNDYVQRTETQVIWLYTGCAYSDTRFTELKDNMLRNIEDKKGEAGMICTCDRECRPMIFK